jgi:PIN domain nuclease of toxin-antitoxin system
MGSIKELNLLLDTHIILWSAAEPERLPRSVSEELENPSNHLWFSPISVWEIHLLAEKGRISIGLNLEKSIRDLFRGLPLKEAVLNQEVAIRSRYVDLPHRDPADRFLAATAFVYGLTFVTADKRFADVKDFQVLAV